jgi:hypothetical protein
MRELDARAFRIGRVFERLPSGASGQIAVAGAYAWVVTVAPALWEGGALLAKAAAGAAIAALLLGAAAEAAESVGAGKTNEVRRRSGRVRVASLWAFVLASALTWLSGPAAIRPLRMDAPRGLAGMLGWSLFALAWAGPALGEPREPHRVVDEAPLEARRSLARGDAAYLAVGTGFALALQFVGWRVASPERALLVRLVALAAGLAFVGASTDLALARHVPRVRRRWRVRWRGARVALVLLATLALAGLLLAARD